MSHITRREANVKGATEPTASGNDWIEVDYEGYAWRCDGCGLVWDRKHRAASCESRKHRTAYADRYGGYVENGQWKGGREYVRQAIRREPVQAAPAAPAAPRPQPRPAVSPTAQRVSQLDRELAADAEWRAYSANRITPRERTILNELQAEIARARVQRVWEPATTVAPARRRRSA